MLVFLRLETLREWIKCPGEFNLKKAEGTVLKVILYMGKTIQGTEAQFSSVSFNTSPLSGRFSPFIFGVSSPVEYRLSREREEGRELDKESYASKLRNQMIPQQINHWTNCQDSFCVLFTPFEFDLPFHPKVFLLHRVWKAVFCICIIQFWSAIKSLFFIHSPGVSRCRSIMRFSVKI